MTIFYEDEYVTLYQGNCLEETAWADEAEVLITDPPYGMGYRSNFAKSGLSDPIAGDLNTRTRDEALILWGEVRPALVFGTWRQPRPDHTIGRTIRQLVVWHKGDTPGMGDLSLPWGPSHEEIYVMGGHGKGHWKGARGPSVIRARTREGTAVTSADHPTPKPVYLMQVLVDRTVGVIADPFAGSGSTLVAAKMLGRKAIGVELGLKYCDVIARRLELTKGTS